MPNPKNPYRAVGAASVEADDAMSLTFELHKAGQPKRTPQVPKEFDVAERRGAISDPQIADALTQRFIYAHIERGSSSNDVLAGVETRARRAPSKRNLERMRSIANEVGRRRGGGKSVRRLVTQEIVDEIIERSHET